MCACECVKERESYRRWRNKGHMKGWGDRALISVNQDVFPSLTCCIRNNEWKVVWQFFSVATAISRGLGQMFSKLKHIFWAHILPKPFTITPSLRVLRLTEVLLCNEIVFDVNFGMLCCPWHPYLCVFVSVCLINCIRLLVTYCFLLTLAVKPLHLHLLL